MKILMLGSSPHTNGTTDLLARSFVDAVDRTKHSVVRLETAKMDISPCMACDYCREHDRNCVQRDDMWQLYTPLREADLVIFVTPVYYYGMTAQLKRVIDRFYAINDDLLGAPKKLMLFAACADDQPHAMDALTAHVRALADYLEWEFTAQLLAFDAPDRTTLERTDLPRQAAQLAKEL